MPLTTSLRIGRVADIELGINWSWLIAGLIAGLIVWVLAAGVFPEANPGLSDRTYVVMALAAAVALFACLLARAGAPLGRPAGGCGDRAGPRAS